MVQAAIGGTGPIPECTDRCVLTVITNDSRQKSWKKKGGHAKNRKQAKLNKTRTGKLGNSHSPLLGY